MFAFGKPMGFITYITYMGQKWSYECLKLILEFDNTNLSQIEFPEYFVTVGKIFLFLDPIC